MTALLSKVDTVLLGGRIAYTFLAAEGAATGDSPVEQEFIPWAKDVLTRHRGHILLPEDHVVARSLDERNEIRIVPRAIPTGFKGLDIGRSASLSFVRELLQGAGTIFSNGPPGGVRNR